MMNELLIDNIDKIKLLCKKHRIKSLYAFGSICSEKFNENSDIDLLVSFYPMDYADYADNYFTVADKLEEIFSRPVDLLSDKSLSNPYFNRSIEQAKSLIYG